MAKRKNGNPVDSKSVAIDPPRMTILSDHSIFTEEEQKGASEGDSFALYSRLGAAFDIIRHKNTRTPLAIAIYGDWGTGKTSAMRWLENYLNQWGKQTKTSREGHMRTRCVWFDPWKYQKRDDVWRGLIAEVIIKAIDVKGASLPKVVSAAKRFGFFLGRSFLNTLSGIKLTAGSKKVGGEASVDLEALTKIVEDYQRTNHPEKAYLNEFEDALKSWIDSSLAPDERMVIFIDDLDRCLPDVVLEVLEALKLYLNIPKLIFVVGVDRDAVDQIVRQHYKEAGLADQKAGQYLAKMFQVEIDIPPSQTQMTGFLKGQIEELNAVSNEYWSEMLNGWNTEYRTIIEQKIATLSEHNPREIKRLLNSTLLRGTAAARDLELRKDEKRTESMLFTQGCQIYLVHHVLRDNKLTPASILREDSTFAFFEKWSKFCTKHPDFRPVKQPDSEVKEGGDSADVGRDKGAWTWENWLSESKSQIDAPPDSNSGDAKQDEIELRKRLPRERGSGDRYPLLDNEDLWDLMQIPFSVDVAASTSVNRNKPKGDDEDDTLSTTSRPKPDPGLNDGAKDDTDQSTVDELPREIISRISKSLNKKNISHRDLRRVTDLDLSSTEIESLALVASLENLTGLVLDYIKFPDLAPLTKLKNLDRLSLRHTEITDLDQLSPLKKLTELKLGYTQIADLRPLESLDNLSRLWLNNTRVFNLAPLSSLKKLANLWLNNTNVTDLSPLSDLTNLTELGIRKTPVVDINPISSLRELQILGLTETQVTDFNPLSSLTNLTELWLNATGIVDLSPLSSIKGLTELGLLDTRVADVAPLSPLVNLRKLGLTGTKVTDLGPLSSLTNLTALWLSDTLIDDLTPISSLTNLTKLYLDNTQVTDLSPLMSLENLSELGLGGDLWRENKSFKMLRQEFPKLLVLAM